MFWYAYFYLKSFLSGWEYKVAYEMNYTGLLAGKIFFKKLNKAGQRNSCYTRSQVCVFTVNVVHNPVCGIFVRKWIILYAIYDIIL